MSSAVPKILVLRNNSATAAPVEQILPELGYEVAAVAESGSEAIRLSQASAPDLVLIDLELGGDIDGLGAADEIRRCCQAPVVFVMAATDERTLSRASGTAPYAYLKKPFDRNELNAAISAALQQHRLLLEIFAENTWLSMLLCSISDAVVATDAHALVRYLNPSAEALSGSRLSDALGKHIEQVYRLQTLAGDPVEECQIEQAIAGVAPTGNRRSLLVVPGGRTTPIEHTAAPIIQDGQLIGAVTVFRDISESVDLQRLAEWEKERLERDFQTTTDALGETRAELRALSDHLLTAQEEQARSIARELHDDFGQRTAILEMRTDRLAQLLGDSGIEVQQELKAIREQIRAVNTGLRNVSHRLHPSILDDLGLLAAVRALIGDFRASGGDVVLKAPDRAIDLPRESAMALYRIAQESLRNAAKHAPGAPVRVTLTERENDVQLSIEDAGPGFDLNDVRGKGGLGLLSMQERARLAGGSLLLRTAAVEGTTLIARVPRSNVRVG